MRFYSGTRADERIIARAASVVVTNGPGRVRTHLPASGTVAPEPVAAGTIAVSPAAAVEHRDGATVRNRRQSRWSFVPSLLSVCGRAGCFVCRRTRGVSELVCRRVVVIAVVRCPRCPGRDWWKKKCEMGGVTDCQPAWTGVRYQKLAHHKPVDGCWSFSCTGCGSVQMLQVTRRPLGTAGQHLPSRPKNNTSFRRTSCFCNRTQF